ncbi:hypothetical protein [Rugosimonospora africana]|uniref:Uncharacterized protein n=1 Tax=Rugosimonospora africana TaxID=556532 RepID=A0A8J3R0H2_9ACTN|nr:hypothetical protein [Rugosimonospora africana]GIH19604.1 hypothetical protein Raf01_77760 [Rugosimonospora africana]
MFPNLRPDLPRPTGRPGPTHRHCHGQRHPWEQITGLEADNAALRERLADRDTTIAELTAFRTAAVSQLAVQHDEILRLRQQIAGRANIRILYPKPDNSHP